MAAISEAIKLARVLCIFLVMFVHVYTGRVGFPVVGDFGPLDVVYQFVYRILGRSSLPLLAILSGWLLVELDRSWSVRMRTRVRTLLVPLFLWNLLMLGALVSWAGLSGDWSEVPATPLAYLDALIALTAAPANIALGFLRDLFVVSALSPLIVLAVRKFGFWSVAALFLLAALAPAGLLILRTQILFFFSLGVFLHQVRFRTCPPAVLIVFALWIAGYFTWQMVALARGVDSYMPQFCHLLTRISLAGLVRQLVLSAKQTKVGQSLIRLEPFTFLAFCSHVITFKVLAVPGRPMFGDLGAPLYPLYFFLQPPLGFAAAIVIAWLLRPAPGVLRALNAGRDPWRAARKPSGTTPPAGTSVA